MITLIFNRFSPGSFYVVSLPHADDSGPVWWLRWQAHQEKQKYYVNHAKVLMDI